MIDLKFGYNEINNTISVDHNGFQAVQLTMLKPVFFTALGFTQLLIHQHKAINTEDKDRQYNVFDAATPAHPMSTGDQSLKSLYVQSNIIQHQTNGGRMERLLSLIPVRSTGAGQQYWKADPPFYLPLMGNTLDTIEIKLKSQKDELYPLERNSHTVARLHFRPRRLLAQSI